VPESSGPDDSQALAERKKMGLCISAEVRFIVEDKRKSKMFDRSFEFLSKLTKDLAS
jgi:hypothetical protein